MADKAAGRAGEDFAARYFEKRGFTVAERNFHSRYGEIDLIAKNDSLLLFVEVKTRKSDRFSGAGEAVDSAKQKKLALTAMDYLLRHDEGLQPRFDVFEAYHENGRIYKFNLIENAFSLSDIGDEYGFFDLHCDTVTRALDLGVPVTDGKMQVKVKNNGVFENYRSCFAVFVSDDFHGKEAAERADRIYAYYRLSQPLFSGMKPMLTVENAAALGCDAEKVSLWKSRGCAMMSLCWNGENELAFGAQCENGGIKPFGKEIIKRLEKEKIAVDLAHISRGGFFAALGYLGRPFAVSHACCDSVVSHQRNLTDDQIGEIISAGGVLGLCFYPEFAGRDVFSGIYKNIRHILSLGGEDIICFGSDFDGAKMSKKLNSNEKAADLYRYLERKGIEKPLLSKIFYKNAENFFRSVLQ